MERQSTFLVGYRHLELRYGIAADRVSDIPAASGAPKFALKPAPVSKILFDILFDIIDLPNIDCLILSLSNIVFN